MAALVTALAVTVGTAGGAAAVGAGPGNRPAAASQGTHAEPQSAAAKPRTTLPGQYDLAGAFVPAGPTRLLDTRKGTGMSAGAHQLGQAPLLLDVSKVTGNPSVRPTAVVLNVTVTKPTGSSYLTVYPSGQTRPATSNLNFGPGQTVPNLVTVPVGLDGSVAFYNFSGTVDVVADLAGYYTLDQAASTFVADGPTRVLDTRTGLGAPKAQLGPGRTVDLTVAGVAGLPASGVSAVVLNVTVTKPTGSSYLTVYPTGRSVPTASNLNFGPGQTVPNLVTVPVGPDGRVSFYNFSGSVDVVADVAGYYLAGAPGKGGVLRNMSAPTRLLDTRNGTGVAKNPVGAGSSIDLKVAGVSEIPASGVSAVVLNVTVTKPTGSSYLTVYPTGRSVPTASNLNFGPGQTVPNLVVVPVGADGKVSFYNFSGSVDVVADVFGYFSTGDHLGLADLNFSAPTVDATAGGASVTATWTVTDSDPAARQTGGTIVIRQQGDAPDSYVGQAYVVDFLQENSLQGGARFVSGDASKATYAYDFVVPRYAGAASTKWAVSTVEVFEGASQQRLLLSGSALNGYGNTFTATEQVSTVTPSQPELSYNMNGQPAYVYNGDTGSISYWVGTQDYQSGFWKGSLELTGPGGAKLTRDFELETYNGQVSYPCQHEISDPTCTAYVSIPADAPAGSWNVSSATVTNNAGQSRTYPGTTLAPFIVTGDHDFSAGDFRVSPGQLNSWRGEAPFTLSMRLSGNAGGVGPVELFWDSNCRQTSATLKAEPDGRYSVSAALPQSNNGSPAACRLDGVVLHSTTGQIALYGRNFGAPDPGVTVRSIPDTTAPVVTSAKLNLTSIPQSKIGSQGVTVQIKVTDATAPVDSYSESLYDAKGTEMPGGGGALTVQPDGTADISVYLPYGTPVGTYTVGFSVADSGWLRSFYGMPGKPPVPGGPLTLAVTAG